MLTNEWLNKVNFLKYISSSEFEKILTGERIKIFEKIMYLN